MNLKEKIEQLCNERGISVRTLEKQAGLKDRTIQHWDRSEPSAQKVHSVANALNVPIEELLSVYNPELERITYIETLKNSSDDLTEEERLVINLYRKADNHDKTTIMQILSRYQEDTSSRVG